MTKANDIKGILIPNTKTFYYVEAGPLLHNNSIEKLQRTLLARGITTAFSFQEENPPRIITLADAIDKDYTIAIIYPSAHLKKKLTMEQPVYKKTIRW